MDGKPVGRLNPSEPLHMTTRRAAAKVNANTSPSTNGSVGDDDARRASLDDARPVASSGLGNPGRRNPGELMNGISDINTSFGAHRSVDRPSGKVKSKPVSSPSKQAKMHESPSPTRKRKRSTPPTPERIPYGLEYAFPHMRETNLDAYLDDDKDRVVVVPPELLSDRESEDDSSDEHEIEDYLAATQSTEITPAATPAASEPVSPVSDESQPTPLYPSKHVDVIMADADQMLEGEEADGGDELADADDGLDEDEVEVEDEDGQSHVGRKKRPYGRRRAEHPVPEVEARMRRQQQLKQAYRYISRALKPILAEIADKTVEELETKPTVHEEVPEYCGNEEEEGVQQLLDQYLTRRKAQLEAQRDFCQAQLRRTLDGERQVRKARCENDIENRREHQVDTLHHDFLLIARQAQLDAGNASYETEDEDEDVIPKLKGMAYRWKRKAALDPAYDSRSRLAMESENAILDLQRRLDMHNMLKNLDDDEKTEDAAEGFTVMESTPREAALARRQNLLNTSILAEAAASVEREVPVIPNEQALGLQLLGDLASRPSIRATAPPPPFAPFGPQLLRQPLAGPPIPAQMPPPPPLRPPISFDREADEGPIRATMSPRTERFVNERGGLPFLLQSPLRQQSMAESRPSEPPLPSPSRSSRGSTAQPVPLQALVSESRNHPLLASPQHQRHTSTDSFDRSFAARDRSESSVPGASDREDSSWEKYRRPLTAGSHSRTPSYQDRAVHEFSHGGPLSIERIATQPEESPVPRASTPPHQPALASQGQLEAFPQPSPLGALELALQASPVPAAVTTSVMSTPVRTAEENHPAQGFTRDESPTHPPHPPKTLPKWDPPSSEGAADSRSQDEGQASEEPKRDLSLEVPTKKSRSRASSLGQSTNTDVSGSQDGSNADSAGARRPQRDSSKGREKFKPNKSDRHGLSRKQHKERRKGASHTTSLDGGQMLRFRLNTSEPTKSPAFTSGPPTGTPHTTHPGLTPYPPLPAYNEPQHQPFPQPGPPPPPPSPRYGYDHSQYYGGHRNSLPGPTGVPAPPWPPHPPSPAYGLPHGLPQHPPPHPHPGWSGSPSNGLGPPPPGLGPQPPAVASHSRYQGPAIAPATPDSRTLGYGGTRSAGGNHPPAFAQQLRNNESSGSRRRTQSDVRGTKFHHYPGPRHKDSA
ncbi:uncharacterized protein MYCFIDRAFT_83376 [Pseudocercospora fijiensis CIRAD86]|uniref:Uncharacterized protein n=1 Tax=Pseudocercospora fijiensis (strain CIRAD86) TaxID=383855 RepID=M3AL46_PSEFD|nr:uncharacterized protein MYCFIDRAFT_83376 [Pseudocercospora fijiensis CIRAD86]EME85281.1 hypothetical protein MYCFIDRAFT_83376 [Pseudocercospora fijiensis CIRAD86]